MSDSDIDERAEALLATHVAFEMDHWRRYANGATTENAVEMFWHSAERTTLVRLIDADDVIDLITRATASWPISDQLVDRLGRIVDDVVRLDVHFNTPITGVVNRDLFDDGVALIIDLEDIRAQAIAHLSNSPLFKTIVSDVLYQGIKDFMLSESGGLGAMPGLGSFLRQSTRAVGRHMPWLEDELDKRIRQFLDNNVARTLARSEKALAASLDEDGIRRIADRIWADMKNRNLSIAELVSADELHALVDYLARFWRSLRDSDYWRELIDAGVRRYYARFGDETVAELLHGLGLDRETLCQQVDGAVPTALDALDRAGLLETIIHRRLAPFYRSAAFRNALHDPR